MHDHQASRTAIIVAKSQALAAASRPGIPQPNHDAAEFSKCALKIAGHGKFLSALKHPLFRRVLRFYESLMIPGLARHHVLRKNAIEERVLNALKSGVHQVIQIGAGLDSLCHRLHRNWPEITFWEFDHPATQKLKRRILHQKGCNRNLILQPLDLADPGSGALQKTISAEIPTIIVIEGVLMYLPPSQVMAWLKNFRGLVGHESRLIFTFMEQPGFAKQSFAVNLWLKLAREPFRWHAAPSSVRALLHTSGWIPNGEHATWLHSGDDKTAAGEWIAEAQSHPSTKKAAPGGGSFVNLWNANDSSDDDAAQVLPTPAS